MVTPYGMFAGRKAMAQPVSTPEAVMAGLNSRTSFFVIIWHQLKYAKMFHMVRLCGLVVCVAVLCYGCDDRGRTKLTRHISVQMYYSGRLSFACYRTHHNSSQDDGFAVLRVVVFYDGLFDTATASGSESFSVHGPDLSVTLDYSPGDHFWIDRDGNVQSVRPLPAEVYEVISLARSAGTFDEEAFESCRSYEEVRNFLLHLADSFEKDTTQENRSTN